MLISLFFMLTYPRRIIKLRKNSNKKTHKGKKMKLKAFLFLIVFLFLVSLGTAEIKSLSQVFLLGKGIKDQDKDEFADNISINIIIPDNPNAHELALAGDIAARANLESLVVDFSLVKKDSEVKNVPELENPILIGANSKWAKKLINEGKISLPQLKQDQGLVLLLSSKRKPYIICTAGSERALLQAGRSFFLRWPYLWDIWGRERGATYFLVEKELSLFLKSHGATPDQIIIRSVLYDFPQTASPHQPLKTLRFSNGEIKELIIELDFNDKKQKEKAFQALESLGLQHLKGRQTEILNYPGCAQTTFILSSGKEQSQVSLHRMGFPKRILTPSYKQPIRPRVSEKNFDLLQSFSSKGFYSDSNRDSILDTVDTCLIVPQESAFSGTVLLGSRLVLDTSGASFPLLYLDSEIEESKSLTAPVLIGQNNKLIKELVRKGKLKTPFLENGWAVAEIVPKAFNASNALAITGSDNTAVEKVLSYLSKTFPYLSEYKAGYPRIHDVTSDLEKFLKGERGCAEAYFDQKLRKTAENIRGKNLESLQVSLYLAQKNPHFENHIQKFLQEFYPEKSPEVTSIQLRDGKTIFEKEKEFPWEADEAIRLIQDNILTLARSELPVKISLGLSESPRVRESIKNKIENLLLQKGIQQSEIQILSAYKQGFFWLLEEVLPELIDKKIAHLTIRFAEERDNLKELKRFYSEPFRWLQELYPVDDIISQETGLALDKIEFEMKTEKEPVYEVLALDENGNLLLKRTFSPRTQKALYLKVLPEWGTVKLTTGWLRIEKGKETVLDTAIKCDLERFWDYYQEEILPQVYSYVMKKTENEPTFEKQPYFKRLQAEIWLSEPDFRLGLDEEIISSLEAIHDELYFDTLDFLRGITKVELKEEEAPEDTSRYSAPGNVLPLIHPSLEGGKGKTKIIFEDWQAQKPQLVFKWKEKGRDEYSQKIIFPSIEAEPLGVPSFIYNGHQERIENLLVEIKVKKEAEYLTLIDLLHSYRELLSQGIVQPFRYPKLAAMTLRIKFKELEKEETLPVFPEIFEGERTPAIPAKNKPIVPTDKIISPQMCLDIIQELSCFKSIRSYTADVSYENRKIQILEIYTPQTPYTSLPRLISSKPTLYLSARQHANEVSATNYTLKFAELLATNDADRESIKKMNLVLHPMENPDGAELAHQLQKLTPLHSLHAGRYSSLGMDIGYQVQAAKPILPEARVRKYLYERWLPDIYLNLHGYPSHEWVQQFSNYSPYLFRDYWIPRGWFAYYTSLRLPIYQKWKEAGEELKEFITREMNANERIRVSNKQFYDRYYRWASRWQPHMDYLELHEGLNLYAERRSSSESKLSARRQITFVEETPELMDETAHGSWLDFLCEQGLTYIRAHTKYLSKAQFERVRIEEESRDRIHIQFIRARPGKVESQNKE